MIGTVNVRCNAAKPNFPLQPLFAFQGSPSSIRILDVPKSIGNWTITSVKVAVTYPSNMTLEKAAVRTGSVWVSTIGGCDNAGKVSNGYEIIADGIDEDGNAVTGYVLGKGDVYVIENDTDIARLLDKYTVRYLDDIPDNPTTGDLMNSNGQLRLFDGVDWILIQTGQDTGVYDSEITISANGTPVGSFTVNQSVAGSIDIPVPSNVSELNNDVGYITASEVPPVPSNLSDYNNDVGYITASAVPSKVSELDNDAGYITASAIPAIPSKTSDLDNDSGFITASAIPSTVSSFENDAGYITANDVVPYTLTASASHYGYAKNAMDAGQLMNFNTLAEINPDYDETSTLRLTAGTPCVEQKSFAPWSLSYYNGTTFDPPIELEFGYKVKGQVWVNGRWRNYYINSYCWFNNASTLYCIPCSSDGVPVGTMTIGSATYSIALSQDGKSIETIDGASGNITCTRASTGYSTTTRNLAFADQVPSAVSQLTNDSGYVSASSSAFTAKRDKTDLVYKVGFDKDNLDKVVKFVVEYVDGNNQNVTATLDKYDEFTQTWTGDNTNWRVYTFIVGMEPELYFALNDGTSGADDQPVPSQGAEDTSWNFTYNSNPATWTMVMTQNIALQQDFKNLRDMKDISYPASVDSTGMYTIQKFNVNGKEVAHFTASGSTSTWDTNDPVVNQYEISTTDGTNFTLVSNEIQLGTFTMTNLKNGAVDVTYEGSTYTVGAVFKQTTFALKDYVDQQIGSVLTEQM